MNQQPDKFFRDKLVDFQKNPPASAWDKIAEAQNKKKSKGFWLRIAATFLVLAAVTYLFWPAKHNAPDATLAETGTRKSSPDSSKTPEPSIQESVEKNEPAGEKPDFVAHQKNSKKNGTRSHKNKIETVNPPFTTHDGNNGVTTVIDDGNEKAIDIASADVTTNEQTNASANPKHVTLTYSADDVSEYLNKNDLAEATSDDKKPSTLKKLLKKANDLKTNQDPFGELRQKKNEILALNFRNDKQRGQNK